MFNFIYLFLIFALILASQGMTLLVGPLSPGSCPSQSQLSLPPQIPADTRGLCWIPCFVLHSGPAAPHPGAQQERRAGKGRDELLLLARAPGSSGGGGPSRSPSVSTVVPMTALTQMSIAAAV